MDRVQPSEGWGRTFESCLARQVSYFPRNFSRAVDHLSSWCLIHIGIERGVPHLVVVQAKLCHVYAVN